MYFMMTTDVESFSIPLSREDLDLGKQTYEVGFSRLFELSAMVEAEIEIAHGVDEIVYAFL
jgi:hypothetical protein